MAIDLNSSIKSFSRMAFGSDTLNNIFGSSVFIALLISIIMIFIIMIFYPAKRGTGFIVLARMFLYMTFTTLFVIFLHDSILKYQFEDNDVVASNDDLMRGITDKNVAYQFKPIEPTSTTESNNITGSGESNESNNISNEFNSTSNEFNSTSDEFNSILAGDVNYVLGGAPPPPPVVNPFK